jgi:hypothetical protein
MSLISRSFPATLPNNVDTDEKKKECFLNGLDDEPAYALEARDFENFQTMVDKDLDSRIGEEYCHASASRSVRFNRTPTLGKYKNAFKVPPLWWS